MDATKYIYIYVCGRCKPLGYDAGPGSFVFLWFFIHFQRNCHCKSWDQSSCRPAQTQTISFRILIENLQIKAPSRLPKVIVSRKSLIDISLDPSSCWPSQIQFISLKKSNWQLLRSSRFLALPKWIDCIKVAYWIVFRSELLLTPPLTLNQFPQGFLLESLEITAPVGIARRNRFPQGVLLESLQVKAPAGLPRTQSISLRILIEKS